VGDVDEDEIRVLVTRLARPDAAGRQVIERAAILAEGADFTAIMDWVIAHGGKPETVPEAPSGGLHGSRMSDSGEAGPRTPLRFVLPAGILA
jgi:hypothetical protein